MSNKNVDFISIDFKDGTRLVLEPMNMIHLTDEQKTKLDEIFTEVYDHLELKKAEAEKVQGGPDIGVNVSEEITTKDLMGK